MKITIRGVRGSIPTFHPGTTRYGGNTSCIEVREDGWLLVLDAGSGITHVNLEDKPAHNRVDILLTHLHIDHIQGLAFFRPLFDPDMDVHIWGPQSHAHSLRARLGEYFSPPLTPVYFRELPCRMTVHEIGNTEFSIGPFTIRSAYIIHPGATVGFRVSSSRGSMAYLPDHEPSLGRATIQPDPAWLSGSDLVSDADLLLHDAQYTRDEYGNRQGWGHSDMETAIDFATRNRVKRLLLMHHDPSHTDAKLNELFAELRKDTPASLMLEMAIEGQVIQL